MKEFQEGVMREEEREETDVGYYMFTGNNSMSGADQKTETPRTSRNTQVLDDINDSVKKGDAFRNRRKGLNRVVSTVHLGKISH